MLNQEYDLYDVIDDELDAGESTEMFGFHLTCQGNGRYVKQPDGYAGIIGEFEASEYDDVLELVHELHLDNAEFWYESDQDRREDRAGPLMTREWEEEHGINPDTGEIEDVDTVEESIENGEMGIEVGNVS